MHELATRTIEGIHVRLLWRNGADENAMDVFHHPYAYAAWHGVPTRPALALTGQT
jgi:hypothetical protein